MELVRRIFKELRSLRDDENGQDMVEYSLLLAFVALAIVGLLGGVKTQLKGILSSVNSMLVSTNTSAS